MITCSVVTELELISCFWYFRRVCLVQSTIQCTAEHWT